jgi:hypothetical protein
MLREIPTTVYVPTMPTFSNTQQLDIWLRSVGGYITGSQSVKQSEMADSTGTIVGKCYAIRVGALAFIQGEVTGISTDMEGIPVAPLFDSFVTLVNKSSNQMIAGVILAGTKVLKATMDVGASYLINGNYIADSALKNRTI